MLAVFSVVISISGSVKYSDATHLPFSGPERERRRSEGRKRSVTSGSEVRRCLKDPRPNSKDKLQRRDRLRLKRMSVKSGRTEEGVEKRK